MDADNIFLLTNRLDTEGIINFSGAYIVDGVCLNRCGLEGFILRNRYFRRCGALREVLR